MNKQINLYKNVKQKLYNFSKTCITVATILLGVSFLFKNYEILQYFLGRVNIDSVLLLSLMQEYITSLLLFFIPLGFLLLSEKVESLEKK